MKKPLVLLFVILILTKATLCLAVPIPPDVKRIVTFMHVLDKKTGQLPLNGTGFFVGVKSPDTDMYTVYLVTAKHVLQMPDTELLSPLVALRLNKQGGGTEQLLVSLIPKGSGKNLFLHKDPTVDLAVIPLLPDQRKYDFRFLPDNYITTKEDFKKLKITEGSEIFFTGLFQAHPGKHKNYPIVRFGRVALITDEKITWNNVETELYLMESTACGGNSGSPVFFYLGMEREPGTIMIGSRVLKFAGIISGFFGELRPIKFVETAPISMAVSNTGIAAVVPAYKLHEILISE